MPNAPGNEVVKADKAMDREDFLSEMGERFDEGLSKMMEEGSDVFAFSFDVVETTAPQTAVVLIRPKPIADEMLAAIEFVRNSAIQADKAFDSAKPKAAKSIDPR